MALWNGTGQVVNDAQEGARIPENAIRLPDVSQPGYQYGSRVHGNPGRAATTSAAASTERAGLSSANS